MDKRVLTCVYCGMEYPQDTPTWGDKVLTDHISVCEKHPMKRLKNNYDTIRKALVGLVGAESKQELEQMEAGIRLAPISDVDKADMINAINAILCTVEFQD